MGEKKKERKKKAKPGLEIYSITTGSEAGDFLRLAGQPTWQKGSVRYPASKTEGEKLKIMCTRTCMHARARTHTITRENPSRTQQWWIRSGRRHGAPTTFLAVRIPHRDCSGKDGIPGSPASPDRHPSQSSTLTKLTETKV